ncbi:hypothetical protein SAMN05660484_01603 [Eubacterium ruminantium]|uniref:Dolichyl-phosphate-mannose-protein mannosyltransferase n=1 Tax=Eubacterium ruminantium TaxID=42322 RepID=A0A1T4NIM5_9FIRM|nr:hypothetical protein [Eubacterium ruminantium]SCW53813.1 hypothetical protein SAMN05660484_01603 [Eubacterium ruminantium]SDM88108.1 hypothetical protein SAMN04490370_10778 [Eubacterium ruminantium]SJZ79084.1 hypothetical protein SAMN02745110_01603 [Eubacterium ruminantium]
MKPMNDKSKTHKFHITNFLKSPASLAILINLIILVLALVFCNIKYEVSDDYIVDSVISGAYTQKSIGYYDVHLLFSNILLGYPLKILYTLIPGISWYFVFIIGLSFVALTALTYVFIKRYGMGIFTYLYLIFLTYFSADLYVIPQFTKTSVAAAVAGGVLFISGLFSEQKKGRIINIILGSLIAILGIFLRFQAIFIALPFLFILFIFYSISSIKKSSFSSELKKIIIRFAACLFLIGIAYAGKYINKALWSRQASYDNFRNYATLRSDITDVSFLGYDSVKEDFEAIGLNETDYLMFRSWCFMDRNIYDDATLSNVHKILKNASDKVTHNVNYLGENLLTRDYMRYRVCWGIFIIFVIMTILCPSGFAYYIISMLVALAGLLYFSWVGRVVYRVEYTIFISCAIVIMLCGNQVKDVPKQLKKAIKYISLTALLIQAFAFIPDSASKRTDEEYSQNIYDSLISSGSYNVKKYHTNVYDRQLYADFLRYVENNDDKYFVMDFSSSIQIMYFNYKPWERIPMGFFNENYMHFGSVTMQYPAEKQLLIDHGLDPDSPIKNLVNDDIYLVDNYYSDVKLRFIQKYYYPNARKELVDIVNGLYIWKIKKQ